MQDGRLWHELFSRVCTSQQSTADANLVIEVRDAQRGKAVLGTLSFSVGDLESSGAVCGCN
jgi:hypothetical protein